MKGNISIVIQNERIKYEFTLHRNLTILKGDSATGKTTLIEMVRDYKNLGEESGVELLCTQDCVVIEGNDWENQLSRVRQSVVFADEGNRFLASAEFARRIQNTDNYYVLVTRESLSTLPYSVEEIYGIRSKGKYGGLKPLYHEMFRLYSGQTTAGGIIPDKIITEDSNAGFQFFQAICGSRDISCVSASGKSNIYAELLKNEEQTVLVIADGAAFGAEIEKIQKLMSQKKGILLYLPESFEWLLLISDVLNDKEIREMREHWEDFIESSSFFSWERFFSWLLIQKSQGSYLQYDKGNLNRAYLNDKIREKILKNVEWWSQEGHQPDIG